MTTSKEALRANATGSTGYRVDAADLRDFSPTSPQVLAASGAGGIVAACAENLPSVVDLREWCTPVEDQGRYLSCCAQAAAGLIEYFVRRSESRIVDASRMFIYKTARFLEGGVGDAGCSPRCAVQAVSKFGAPPEQYWPYDEAHLDAEPTAAVVALASRNSGSTFYRHDAGAPGSEVVASIKAGLTRGYPCMIGFTRYRSYFFDDNGRIAFPGPSESAYSPHAVVAVGYDDGIRIRNRFDATVETLGAFIIRNSLGAAWGDCGYGALPYEYVVRRIAFDCWSLTKQSWSDTL